MNLCCVLIESVLKYQIKFALFYPNQKNSFECETYFCIQFEWTLFCVLCFAFALSIICFDRTFLSLFLSLCVCMQCGRNDAAVCGIIWCAPYFIPYLTDSQQFTHSTYACDEFLCVWIKCCSTHMITEKAIQRPQSKRLKTEFIHITF